MKTVVNTSRILVGSLFIFSGLVKAIDPLGLAYKMQEFFEVWGNEGMMKSLMNWLNGQALWFSLLMITLEVVLGVALLLGFKTKPVSWLLLMLMIFFTFLTSYVLFSGKIRACGCFGDCIPLTPSQTFTKDIILLLLVLLILFNKKYIKPIFPKGITLFLVLFSLLAVSVLQWYVLRHLPLKDCLPYKKGNDLLKLREMPADAIPDKYEYSFSYQKNGEKREFNNGNLPDSSWQYVDRKQTLVQKGKNNVPLINDFTFTSQTGTDTTAAILGQSRAYYLLFINDLDSYPSNWDKDKLFIEKAVAENKPVYFITGQPEKVKEKFAGKIMIGGKVYEPLIFTCDVTAIKTAARANPVVFSMKGPVVQGKWSWADFGEIINN